MPPSVASQAPPHPQPIPPRLSCCSREVGARRARDVDLKFAMPELFVPGTNVAEENDLSMN
ncbi:hypothetical protein BDA96_04G296800 [Sorghum bicolor]|uniref:Uncharacterized protein n=1 Tax=Sorghum bicolor TaxID=4558 RepID=A0A921UMA3_SORBI|nr:hypothetical protein BDA96_04G296800 [Sorghum bicolor]